MEAMIEDTLSKHEMQTIVSVPQSPKPIGSVIEEVIQ
jgi:hypothetical protein